MTERQVKRIFRQTKLTKREAERDRRIREEVQKEYPPGQKVVIRKDPTIPATQGDIWALHDFILDLKEERLRQNLTLQDIQDATGIDRAVLSRLETGKNLNPTFATLSRYAWALGKTLSIMLAEREKETGKKTTDQTAQKSRKAQ
jgi:DNA-binding Xre family transcriptional regulator